MTKILFVVVFLISVFPGLVLSKSNSVRYQNMQFSGGEMNFRKDFSSKNFKSLVSIGTKCTYKNIFCVDFEGMPFVAPCEIGNGRINNIDFRREENKPVQFLGIKHEIFVVEAVEKKIRIRYFWSKKGLVAFVLFVDSDFALFLPFENELLQYPAACKSIETR